MDSDKAAIDAVKRGERDRFSDLVERHKRMVYAIAWSHLGDADMAEDAAQEAFIRAFRYIGALRDVDKFPAWLSKIARNVSVSLLRRRRRELNNRKRWLAEQPEATQAPDYGESDENLTETLGRALEDLAPMHRECLVLFYYEEKSVAESAALLGISESAMKTRLHRARAALRGELEKEIERGLGRLGPCKGFSSSVMLLLPQHPLGVAAAGGGASLLAKAGSWLWGLLPLGGFSLFMAVWHFSVPLLLMSWFAKMESANMVPKPENAFRKAVLRRNAVVVAVGMGCAMLFSMLFRPFGLVSLDRVLAIYCGWGLYQNLGWLRVNRSAYVKGQILSLVFLFACCVLIGFFRAPWIVFFGGLAVMNIVLAWTNRRMPRRQDYNLFLRQAMGGLGQAAPDGSASCHVTESEQRAFARFLGEQWLVRGYSQQGGTISLRLPFVQPGLLQSFLMVTFGDSKLTVDSDGSCRAHLGRRDAKAIKRLKDAPADAAALEVGVCRVLESALRHFLEGRLDDARNLLSTVPDEEVFHEAYAKTRGYRWQAAIGIAASVLLLVFVCQPRMWRANASAGWHPQPVSREMVREAVDKWVETYGSDSDRGPFFILWHSNEHPSLGLMGTDGGDAYKRIVRDRLKAAMADGPDAAIRRIRFALHLPQLLHHAVFTPTLSEAELASLGFEKREVREAIAALSEKERHRFFEVSEVDIPPGTDYRGVPYAGYRQVGDLDRFAMRLRLLRHYGCLDVVDTGSVAAFLSSHQVTRDWERPEGYHEVDRVKAEGLFHLGYCGLQATWAALSILETLDELDRIDREACIEGILRSYRGEGTFRVDDCASARVYISGSEKDAYYAMESLAILGALDRVDDFSKWKFRPETGNLSKDGRTSPGHVTADSLRRWAYQEALEKRRSSLVSGGD